MSHRGTAKAGTDRSTLTWMPSGPQDLLGFNLTSLFFTSCSSVNGLNLMLFLHLSVLIGKDWRNGDSSVRNDAKKPFRQSAFSLSS